MLESFKNLVRGIIPKQLFKLLQPVYHGLVAQIAGLYFGHPSRDLYVIGITGTAGKSTTAMMIAHILNSTGKKTGYITTVGTFDGQTEKINKHGLSMPGGWLLQKTMHEFSLAGAKYVVIEATSEGLAQNRHIGIDFRMALFTNLSPAHIDSHGSFENYRNAKGKLFSSLISDSVIGVNTDDPNYQFFLQFPARKKFGTSTREDKIAQTEIPVLRAEDIHVGDKLEFSVEGNKCELDLKGSFNISNALLAIGAVGYLGVNSKEATSALNSFGTVPGRMEVIPNNKNITIIVDYSPEPAAMEQSLRSVVLMPHKKLIHVFGSTGGHRDTAKRFEFGKLSGKFADTIIITNDDVYDSDESEIAAQIKEGIKLLGEDKKVTEVLTILNRRHAIQKALEIAEPEDIILISGKGSEQFLVLPGNKRIAWDDREVVKEYLN